MFYRLRLAWRVAYSKTIFGQRLARLERQAIDGLLVDESITRFMEENNLYIAELLSNISHSETREIVRKKCVEELRLAIRGLIREVFSGEGDDKRKALLSYRFDIHIMEFISCGGKLKDLFGGGICAEQLTTSGSEKVSNDIIKPKLAREYSDARHDNSDNKCGIANEPQNHIGR